MSAQSEAVGAVEAPADVEKITDTSLVGFYTNMASAERRTFWVCSVGWGIDSLDFLVYPLVIGTLIKLWSVAPGVAGLAVTVTPLSSAVGGWLAGYLADRIGRVRTLSITILWFSAFTLLCAMAQNFEQLLAARALLGIGFGGEYAAGAILMGETIRAQYRGRAVGAVQSWNAIGWGGAVLGQAIMFSLLAPEVAWRWLFVIGALPAIVLLFFLRTVEEPPVAAVTRARQAQSGERPSIWEIFSGPMAKTTILASLMSTGAQGGYYAISTWLPRFLTTERHLSIVNSTSFLGALIVATFLGLVTGGWLADRIGRRNLFLVFSAASLVVAIAYTQMPLSNEILWVLGVPLGFSLGGYYGGMGSFLMELYPTRLRGSGVGFCYNFGRGIGAVFPTMVGYLSERTALSTAIVLFAAGAYFLFFLAAYALPETRGKVLHAD